MKGRPTRVLPLTRPLPLFGPAATREMERRALAARPPQALMQRAGLAVARLALATAPHARRVWIAAGPGNNGGDGFEAAIHLRRWGREVRVWRPGGSGRLPADAAAAVARAQAAGVAIDTGMPADFSLDATDIAIDALLGIGARRAPDGALAAAIDRLNALVCPVLAVDLPSGLDAATGQPLGRACVTARCTLALLTLKPGLFTGRGRDIAGDVWFDDLGVDPTALTPDAWLDGDAATDAARSRRPHASHKGSFGDVAVVGGAPGMTGAALLAARAAHAAGAGRVFVDLVGGDDDPARLSLDALRPELMFRPGWWRGPPQRLAAATVVCGCGGGDAVRATLPALLARAGRLVLDADALNHVAADPALQTALAARGRRGLGSVLTPHPLEAARLLGTDTARVQADRLDAARELAARFACVVVLKGSGSVIAAPDRVPVVNATGNAALASAGTGDVLAGWLGGLWSPAPNAGGGEVATPGNATATAFEAACRAVASHGAAADPPPGRPGPTGPLRAADLIEVLHRRLDGSSPQA